MRFFILDFTIMAYKQNIQTLWKLESIMRSSTTFLENHLMPIVTRVGSNQALTVIRNAMCACMALLIIGSTSILLSNIPWTPLANFMAPAAPVFNTIFNATTGIMGLLTAASVAYYGALEYKQDIFVTIATSVSLFVLSQYQLVNSNEYQLNIDGLGTSGLISAILIAFVTLKTLALFKQKNITIRMPKGVPDAVSESFTSLLPALFLLTILSLLVVIFHININVAIAYLLSPVTYVLNSAPGYAFYHMLCALVFFSGINSQVVIGITMPFLMQNGALNEKAFQAGEQLMFAATNATDAMVWAGGTGATLGLVVLMSFMAKSQYFKKLGRMSLGPGLFNINEPIIFGTPICFNPLFMLPFILTPGLIAGSTYLLMQHGIIDLPHVANLPWTTPTFIVGFLMTGGSISTTLWSFMIIVISMLIYFPFFRMADNQLYLKEQQDARLQDEESK
jgi:PTS system cellobiose-specific IIC component